MTPTFEKSFITYELAHKLIHAAIAHAKKINLAISVAIVDSIGNLVAFARMDGCYLIAIGTSQGKAFTAARNGLKTCELKAFFETNHVCISSLKDENLVLIGGGLPIFYQNQIIGGIGIGGGTAAQDEACAEAALETIAMAYTEYKEMVCKTL